MWSGGIEWKKRLGRLEILEVPDGGRRVCKREKRGGGTFQKKKKKKKKMCSSTDV